MIIGEIKREENRVVVDFILKHFTLKEEYGIVEAFECLYVFNPFTDHRIKLWNHVDQRNLLYDKIIMLGYQKRPADKQIHFLETSLYAMKLLSKADGVVMKLLKDRL